MLTKGTPQLSKYFKYNIILSFPLINGNKVLKTIITVRRLCLHGELFLPRYGLYRMYFVKFQNLLLALIPTVSIQTP